MIQMMYLYHSRDPTTKWHHLYKYTSFHFNMTGLWWSPLNGAENSCRKRPNFSPLHMKLACFYLPFLFMAWLHHIKPWLIMLSKCSQWQCNPRKYNLSKTCHWILHLPESEITVKLWKVGYRCDKHVLVCFQISYIMLNLEISLM